MNIKDILFPIIKSFEDINQPTDLERIQQNNYNLAQELKSNDMEHTILGDMLYTQKLNEQITVLKETIEIYKLYKGVQEKQIEELEERLQRSMKLNEELLATAKKAIAASYQSINV